MERRDCMTDEERKKFEELCRKLAAQMKFINNYKERQVAKVVA